MIFSVILPLIIGSFGVLQNTLNKKFGESLGVPFALIVNNLVLLAGSVILYFALRAIPQEALPELFRQKSGWEAVTWRNLIPGFLGLFIIATAPWAIEKVGATKVFIGIIAAQIIVSVIWDWYVENMPVSTWRLVGGSLALIGAFLSSL